MMFSFLDSWRQPTGTNQKFAYSNFGMALLGETMALRSERTYEELLQERVLKPLGMNRTSTSSEFYGPDQHIAAGSTRGLAIPSWNWQSLAPAGGLRSTMNDMLVFVAANAGIVDTNMEPTFEIAHQPHFRKSETAAVGLGWGRYETPDNDVLFQHNGSTDGFTSFVGFLKRAKKGIVILANTGNLRVGVNDIGQAFLRDQVNFHPPPKRSIATVLEQTINTKGVDAARRKFKAFGSQQLEQMDTSPRELFTLGLMYRKQRKFRRALLVHDLNTVLHPASPDVFEDLADAYFEMGNMSTALKWYCKAVRLGPGRERSVQRIKEIEEKRLNHLDEPLRNPIVE